MMQQNNNNLSAVVRRLLKFATHRTGAFETINLIITHLNRVNLVTMKDLQLQHSLEDGFNHINRKLTKGLIDVVPERIKEEGTQQSSPVKVQSPIKIQQASFASLEKEKKHN